MNNNQVFEIIAVFNPTEKEIKDGQTAQIIVQPTTVLAVNEQTAGLMAARAIPEEYAAKLDRVAVTVRPF